MSVDSATESWVARILYWAVVLILSVVAYMSVWGSYFIIVFLLRDVGEWLWKLDLVQSVIRAFLLFLSIIIIDRLMKKRWKRIHKIAFPKEQET